MKTMLCRTFVRIYTRDHGRRSLTLARHCSTSGSAQNSKSNKQPGIKIESEPPSDVKCDWIGPPDKDSNLRKVQFHIPQDETPVEKEFRLRRQETWEWNHQYWASHNQEFLQEKEEFVKAKLDRLGQYDEDGKPRKLTAEEISEFYRKFLNENAKKHRTYNRQWYVKNVSLLWPAVKVTVSRTLKKFRSGMT